MEPVKSADGPLFPALSRAVASSVSPFVCDGTILTEKVPSLLAAADPSTLPLTSVMVTRLPASAEPVTVAPSTETARSVGASGAIRSTVIVNGSDGSLVFPAWSVAVKRSTWLPCASGVSGVRFQLPSLSTIAVPIISSPRHAVIIVPASPLPVSTGRVSSVG